MRVVIVQNTKCHFETVISLYQTCRQLNFEPALYICDFVKKANAYDQLAFLRQHDVEPITLAEIKKEDVCFVISAHPNKRQILPNSNDPVFHQGFNCLFISHRFDAAANYNGKIVTKQNSFCLSPAAAQRNLKHIWLSHAILTPTYTPLSGVVNISVQGHFRFGHRRLDQLQRGLRSSKNYVLNLIGSESRAKKNKFFANDSRVHAHANITETEFYHLCNAHTHFFLPLIDYSARTKKYIKDVYSSTFNIAAICEKPIFAHEVFKAIYKLPGLYYTADTFNARLEDLLSLSATKYRALVDEYAAVKKEMLQHNNAMLSAVLPQS